MEVIVMDLIRKDKWLIGYFGGLTLLLMVFHALFANSWPSIIIMVINRISLMVVALASPKKFQEQHLLAIAFVLSVIADFFLVFLELIFPYRPLYDVMGMLGFIGTYLVLNMVFFKKFRFVIWDILVGLPFLAAYGIIVAILRPYATGLILDNALALGVMLCFTGANMAATVYRGYFKKNRAVLIALAGVMIFTCDMFVAFGMFHPAFSRFVLWVENTTWIIYTVEWLVLLLLVRDESLINLQKEGSD